eukprot:Anaeramoba_flamelloidesa808432_88.p1 GENE.a808432_88~~a808432_88.p1  ORF type:complete len:233 (+),score=66.11 a808432_88:563-1261(+)
MDAIKKLEETKEEDLPTRWKNIFSAITWAPSAVHEQDWRVVFEKENRSFHFFVESKRGHYCYLNIGIAMLHFELSCVWYGWSGEWEKQKKPKFSFELPKNVKYCCTYTIGKSNKKEKKEEEYGFTDLASGEEMSVVIKTTTRQTIYLPVIGLVDPFKLHPGDLVGVNKDSYLILDLLPREYDTRVKAMELDEKPKETYNDIGGLDKQIRELMEAVVYPLTEKEKFQKQKKES